MLVTDPLLAIGGDDAPVAHMEPSGRRAGRPARHVPSRSRARAPGFLLQLRAGEPPLRFVTAAPTPSCTAAMADGVSRRAETMDVSEPTERVRAALALIAAGESTAAQAA